MRHITVTACIIGALTILALAVLQQPRFYPDNVTTKTFHPDTLTTTTKN